MSATEQPVRLTPRERQILLLIGSGLNGRGIAQTLGISYDTVRKHRSNILAKLVLSGSAQLSAHAARLAAGDRRDRHSTRHGPP